MKSARPLYVTQTRFFDEGFTKLRLVQEEDGERCLWVDTHNGLSLCLSLEEAGALAVMLAAGLAASREGAPPERKRAELARIDREGHCHRLDRAPFEEG